MDQATTLGRSQGVFVTARQIWIGLVALLLAAALIGANWLSTPVNVSPAVGRISPALTFVREAPAVAFEQPVGAQTSAREAPAAKPTITDTNVGAREGNG
jgi:hypothetical protein